MPASACEAFVRAAPGLARYPRALFADRRVLRPSRHLALGWPQRGERAALPVSRLEIRLHRPMHRGAVGAGGIGLLQEDQVEVLSAGEARRRALGLYGPTRETAAIAGMGILHGASGTELHFQAAAGVQLAAGARRRHRFEPQRLAASRRVRIR